MHSLVRVWGVAQSLAECLTLGLILDPRSGSCTHAHDGGGDVDGGGLGVGADGNARRNASHVYREDADEELCVRPALSRSQSLSRSLSCHVSSQSLSLSLLTSSSSRFFPGVGADENARRNAAKVYGEDADGKLCGVGVNGMEG